MGIGGQDDLALAERFVAGTGTTFTMLWSDSSDSWFHYGVRRNSSLWLLDGAGNRVGGSPMNYDESHVKELLAGLV